MPEPDKTIAAYVTGLIALLCFYTAGVLHGIRLGEKHMVWGLKKLGTL